MPKLLDLPSNYNEQITFTNQVIEDIERLLNILKDRNWLPIYQIIDSVDIIYVITTGYVHSFWKVIMENYLDLINSNLREELIYDYASNLIHQNYMKKSVQLISY